MKYDHNFLLGIKVRQTYVINGSCGLHHLTLLKKKKHSLGEIGIDVLCPPLFPLLQLRLYDVVARGKKGVSPTWVRSLHFQCITFLSDFMHTSTFSRFK